MTEAVARVVVVDPAPEIRPSPSVQTPPQSPLAVYLAGLAPSSRATVRRHLRVVAALFGTTPDEIQWQNLRYAHLVAIKARLEAPNKQGRVRAPATINAALSHLRGIAREGYNLGQMTAEDYERIKGDREVGVCYSPAAVERVSR